MTTQKGKTVANVNKIISISNNKTTETSSGLYKNWIR